jgi:hypothetical protein
MDASLLSHRTILCRMYPSQSQPQTVPHLMTCECPRRYSAYGLAIRSEVPLPEFPVLTLTPGDEPVDVSVVYGKGNDWIDPVRNERSFWSILPGEAQFWFQGVGGFLVRGGREIIISPEPGIEQSLLRMYVEGMMMACLLHQRGLYVLHASVVQIGDYGIAFLGHIGAGKSSMAAALHARGHAVVTDDNAAIDLSNPAPLVTPAFPFVKVFPEIAISLGYADDSLAVMHASQLKRSRSVSRAFPERPIPLRRIYILTRDNADGITRLSLPETTLELIRNSVPTRWRQPGDAAHLRHCGRFARAIPAWRVRTFDTLPALPELANRIEAHEMEQRREDSGACI